MAEVELVEEVVVQSSDIVVIRDALNMAYYLNVSLDMVDGYRDELPSGKTSPLTARLDEARGKANAIILLAQEESSPDPEESS